MYDYKSQQNQFRKLLEDGSNPVKLLLKLESETLASGSPTGEASVALYTGLAADLSADVLPAASAHADKLLVILNLDATYTVAVGAIDLGTATGAWVGYSDGTAWRTVYTNGT